MFRQVEWTHEEWDHQLDRVAAWAPHNYSGWAKMKSLDGWSALRIVDPDDLPIAQVLIKKVQPWATVAYCPGGFTTQSPIDAKDFTHHIARWTKSRLMYVRPHMITPTSILNLRLSEYGWVRVYQTMSSGQSLELRLDTPEAERLESLSTNWKRNLHRSSKHENFVAIEQAPNAELISRTHRALVDLKGEHLQSWESNSSHVTALIHGFGSRLVIAKCTNRVGDLLAVRGAVLTANGKVAFDIIASTTADGRKHYSSHACFWALANELSRRGVVRYDLGGVDEANNKGVFDFKNGTGAVPIAYGGEFDTATPKAIRPMLSRIMSRVA
jgi:lipid II:glycine glycyltransferase (peptidoglycan interpeptide bridge formation enzyme)